MRISSDGLYLIKKYEGLHKKNEKTGMIEAYLDPVRIPTIGFGHTKGVKLGQIISPIEAEVLLLQDTKEAEDHLASLVTVPLHQHEFDAIISFTFNAGPTNLKKSTMLRLLNEGKKEQAAKCLLAWDKARLDGKLVALPGLTKRRLAEMNLFLYGPGTLYDKDGGNTEEWTTSLEYLGSAHILITTSKRAA